MHNLSDFEHHFIDNYAQTTDIKLEVVEKAYNLWLQRYFNQIFTVNGIQYKCSLKSKTIDKTLTIDNFFKNFTIYKV